MNNDKAGQSIPHYDAVVVGAGLAGLYTLHRLREMGKNVIAFEAGDGVGGTWYWNRYPGCRVDAQCYNYQYWFPEQVLKSWDWSERFPSQPENEAYLNFVADTYDLRRDLHFHTRVTRGVYDEARSTWRVYTDRGDVVDTPFFICCVGILSDAIEAPFPGRENFKGMVCHTSRWPKTPVDFTGKRVGVVGTGATGIQVTQTVAPLCRHLTVFQRTANYTVPMHNYQLDDAANRELKQHYPEIKQRSYASFSGFDFDFDNGSFYDHTPEERRAIYERLWADGSFTFWLGSFFELFVDEAANQEISDFVRAKIRARVKDPQVAEKLMPRDYGFGTRRVPLDSGYFETFNRDNVTLVDVKPDPIECITESGLRLTSGQEYPLDILILATGFDAGTGAFAAIDIHGRDGRTLKAKWDRDIRTTLGLQVEGFPNLFTIGAPLAPSTALCNMYLCMTEQADWALEAIRHMDAHGLHSMEPTREMEDAWVEHHDAIANSTLVTKTDSWYMGCNVKGKPRRLLSYIGGSVAYRKKCDEIAEGGYAGFIFG
ncbi:MAG: NAD(P)/FAD-dependent oxidoreductase [Nevskiaceae bacterium]|nr:MAG: NAD(P)/FAD-dependent oxidoreductase [Nevskiaceae bacterium]TBR74413.1 MAG: NAD(P)/FAD-dependent oxidoreductase [Nevskiaceae bacterium]